MARISWPDKQIRASAEGLTTLINAHFDSVQGSPGGADDGVGVACMLEIAKKLATGPPLKNPVVFLFNGAEEVIQLVSTSCLSLPDSLTVPMPLLILSRSRGLMLI